MDNVLHLTIFLRKKTVIRENLVNSKIKIWWKKIKYNERKDWKSYISSLVKYLRIYFCFAGVVMHMLEIKRKIYTGYKTKFKEVYSKGIWKNGYNIFWKISFAFGKIEIYFKNYFSFVFLSLFWVSNIYNVLNYTAFIN